MLLVAPLVFPGAGGPGRCVCRCGRRPARWPSALSSFARRVVLPACVACGSTGVLGRRRGPAARETRRLRFARCRVSEPDRALRSLRRPPHQWGRVAGWRVVLEPGRDPSSPHRCRVHTSLAALLAFLVQCVARLKPLSPLWPGLCAWVKPPLPLLARNVCFAALWASKGVAGFKVALDARAVVSRVSLGRHLCAVVCSKGPSTSCHLPVGLAWWNVPSVAGLGSG